MTSNPNLDGSFCKFELVPLLLTEFVDFLRQSVLGLRSQHLPPTNNMNYSLLEDSWTLDSSTELSPDCWIASYGLPEHLILPHQSQIDNFSNVTDCANGIRDIEENEAVIDCGTERTLVKDWVDTVEAAEEPVPTLVFVFAVQCDIRTSRGDCVLKTAGLADLLRKREQSETNE